MEVEVQSIETVFVEGGVPLVDAQIRTIAEHHGSCAASDTLRLAPHQISDVDVGERLLVFGKVHEGRLITWGGSGSLYRSRAARSFDGERHPVSALSCAGGAVTARPISQMPVAEEGSLPVRSPGIEFVDDPNAAALAWSDFTLAMASCAGENR